MLSVYVAGSSHPDERRRVEDAVSALKAAKVKVESTWLADVAAHAGQGNPRDLETGARRALAVKDLGQVASAHILWFLVPPVEIPTRGAWAELAYAYSMGKRIVCSGDTLQSIFCGVGYETTSDAIALQTVISLTGGDL